MASPIRSVFLAFPEYSKHLPPLADRDPAIGELCDDFDAVVDAHWRSIEGESPSIARAQEYHGLRLELESELLARLQETWVAASREQAVGQADSRAAR